MGKVERAARAARRAERCAERPERYWFPIRWMDGRWGRSDGRANLLAAALEDAAAGSRAPAGTGEVMSLTPHLGMIDHQYLGGAAAVRARAEGDFAEAVQGRQTLAAQIPIAADRLAAAQTELEAFGEAPSAERLARRNSAETHQSPEQIAKRNRREWVAERAPLCAGVESAASELESLKNGWAQLDAVIISRRGLAGRRAAMLQAHALRRHRYYERRLVRRHALPEGAVPGEIRVSHHRVRPVLVSGLGATRRPRPADDDNRVAE